MTYRGFHPYPWQRAVINLAIGDDARGKVICCKSRRQCGKSIMMENLLLWYACNKQNSVSALVSPTLPQARKVFKDIVNAVEKTGVIKKKNETLLEITLINGSQIFMRSAEQRDALRGYTVTGILCIDEAVFMTDDILERVLPWVQVHKAPILMVSSPRFKTGFFWRYYSMATDDANISRVDWNNWDTSNLLTKEQLEMYKRMLPKAQFTSEYMGEFLDDEGIVFSYVNQRLGNPSWDFKNLWIGIDWAKGSGGDYTCLAAFNEKGQMVFIKYFNNLGANEQIEEIVKYLKPWVPKIRKIRAETNGLGAPMVEALKARDTNIGRFIEGFNTTNAEKIKLVNALQLALEQGDIQLLDDEKLKFELNCYQAEFNPKTNTLTYNAPQGCHDDTCMATMFAWSAYKDSNKTGTYTFSFL